MAASLMDVLRELQTSGGLDMAAIVSSDGLVIDSSSNGNIDVESFCSVASNAVLVMDSLGAEVGAHGSNMMTIEYGSHTVVMTSLDGENLLVLLGGADINLGRMRIILRRRTAELTDALEHV